LLTDGAGGGSVTEPALAPLLALHARLRERRPRVGLVHRDSVVEVEGVLLTDFVKTSGRSDGWRRYMNGDVAASLQRRGLLSETNGRTDAGEQAEQQLDVWLDLSNKKFRLWSHDPDWVRSFLGGAGAAVLLAEDCYPELTRVCRDVAICQPSDQALAVLVGPPGDGDLGAVGMPDGVSPIDFSGLDQALASVAGLDGAFDILDASLMAVGGGGDGAGGGDGGGGG
jgi:hypothetical protein